MKGSGRIVVAHALRGFIDSALTHAGLRNPAAAKPRFLNHLYLGKRARYFWAARFQVLATVAPIGFFSKLDFLGKPQYFPKKVRKGLGTALG
jgi:hypothetical protein